ncbi:unnamed protein product [Cylindrotheca closterium]|uniref:Nudix hydrolase domain-containing protein n=1 Tax=Cylindrotheca closterium TaxID=2856 RepID=A0AAD2FUG1_9STRA|nr:unnamed protein product [Cylindrotheca closterium]
MNAGRRMILKQSRILRLSTGPKFGSSALRFPIRSHSSSMPKDDSELKGSGSENGTTIREGRVRLRLPKDDSELKRSESANGKTMKEGRDEIRVPRENSAAVHHTDEESQHQRVWLPSSADEPLFWNEDVVKRNTQDPHNLSRLLDRIEKQELEGGRYRMKQYGVLHEDPAEDMRLLSENYTIPALASALRDREDVLQYCAQLADEGDFEKLQDHLHNFHPSVVLNRRNERRVLDVRKPLNAASLETIRKALMRMPRRVTQAHSKRAGVVIAICHVDGVPSIILERRAETLRAHPDEVCSVADKTIVETCLREMKEEIGGLNFDYHGDDGGYGISVLGVLRCNWGEVHHMVGVAVTPVVCFLGQDLAEIDLKPNPDEVSEVFTVPLASVMDKSQWLYKDDHAPIFVGGPYLIFGLTGYIMDRFFKDILLPNNVKE